MAATPNGGSLAAAYPPFGAFLECADASAPRTDTRFAYRNFRLDERIPSTRVESYREVAESSLADFSDWHDAHWDYILRALCVDQPPSGLPRHVDPRDLANCAESFHADDAMATLSQTDPSVELVRVERLVGIADAAGVSEAEVLGRFSAVEAGSADRATVNWVDAVLGRWIRTRDLRPAWAALWEDCADVLDANPRDPDWAQVLRDRFGLAHLDPALTGRAVPIIVFRYPVRLLPTLLGVSSRRALAFPTVLDEDFTTAFCPAPTNSTWGRVVDLAANGTEPAREVLHPPIRVKPLHVCAVGTVEAPVRLPLDEARGLHLLWLQDAYDRDDFAGITDEDLLA